ncbi:MAG: hypothetical protein RLZZ77_582 [Bacteroidota bacterium]
MKVISLVLNNFKNDNRVYRIAKSLQDKGHEVSVVALKKGEVSEREVFQGLPVHRIVLKSSSLPNNNKLFGAIKYLEFFLKVIFTYRKVDVWHCNDFEAFLVGALAKMTRPKLKLVYDAHEYERERLGQSKWVSKFVALGERLFIRWTEIVITVGPSIKKEYERLYAISNVFLVRNTPHARPKEKHDVFRQKLGLRVDQKIFLYQGVINSGRGIEVLVEAFEKRTSDNAVLVVMGYGTKAQLVMDAAQKSKIIYYHPAVPYEEIITYSSSADVGLNTPQNHCLSYYYCLPNKLFEYIQAGIPILSNNLPDCRALIESYGIGEVIDPYTADGVNAAVDMMLSADFTAYHRGLDKAASELHWDKEVEALYAAYQSVLK